MRAYFFCNMYLSSIQNGLQSGHVIAEMFIKYEPEYDEELAGLLSYWAKNHKTMILLNAGYSETIHELVKFFYAMENPYPWASFCESKEALDGALTCTGIILPEKVYEAAAFVRANPAEEAYLMEHGSMPGYYNGIVPADSFEFTKWETLLIQKLNTFGMAK